MKTAETYFPTGILDLEDDYASKIITDVTYDWRLRRVVDYQNEDWRCGVCYESLLHVRGSIRIDEIAEDLLPKGDFEWIKTEVFNEETKKWEEQESVGLYMLKRDAYITPWARNLQHIGYCSKECARVAYRAYAEE